MGYTLKIGRNSIDDFVNMFLKENRFELLDRGVGRTLDLVFNIVR